MKWLLDLIQVNIDSAYRGDFSQSNIEHNRQRGVVMGALVFLFELLFFIGSFNESGANVFGGYTLFYRSMYLIILLPALAITIGLHQLRFHKNKNRWVTVLMIIATVFILNWSALITAVDISRGVHSPVYLFIAMTVGVVVIMRPIRSFSLFATSLIVFTVMLWVMVPNKGMVYSGMINTVSFIATSWIISMLLYKYRADDYIKQRIISEQNEQLQLLTITDPLTGLFNRRKMEGVLTDLFHQSLVMDDVLAVMMIDIDYYKGYNDTYGHIKGDEILIKIGETLVDEVRSLNGSVCRYGGDELCIILKVTDESTIQALNEQLVHSIEDLHIENLASKSSQWVTISLGSFARKASDTLLPWNYVQYADKDLYKQKHERLSRRAEDR